MCAFLARPDPGGRDDQPEDVRRLGTALLVGGLGLLGGLGWFALGPTPAYYAWLKYVAIGSMAVVPLVLLGIAVRMVTAPEAVAAAVADQMAG